MCHDDNVLASLQLHNDRFQADDHVAVRLASPVTVIVFIVVAGAEVFRVGVFDFLVGHAVADSRIELVERLPFELVVSLFRRGKMTGGLDRAAKGRGPDCELCAFRDGLLY